jgi:hypothetical protein
VNSVLDESLNAAFARVSDVYMIVNAAFTTVNVMPMRRSAADSRAATAFTRLAVMILSITAAATTG